MKRLAALFALVSLLSGCALAALPVVTGGVLATRDVIRDNNDRSRTSSVERGVEETDGAPQLTSELGGPLPAPTKTDAADLALSAATAASIDLANPYTPLIAYAAQAIPSENGESDQTLLSAVLSEPSALDGKRNKCVGKEPVLLIDIDPNEGLVNLDQPFAPNTALAAGLATLRQTDIEIAWISGAPASQAAKLRSALNATGLDPKGSDTLLLMRYKADRKQTRRAELAASNCIIAIAGGSRKDFDELYEYLLEPTSAFALETMMNNGWFLTPNALTQD